MNTAEATVLGCAALLGVFVVIGYTLRFFILSRLMTNHRSEWVALGKPSRFLGSDDTDRAEEDFLSSRSDLKLSDQNLSRICMVYVALGKIGRIIIPATLALPVAIAFWQAFAPHRPPLPSGTAVAKSSSIVWLGIWMATLIGLCIAVFLEQSSLNYLKEKHSAEWNALGKPSLFNRAYYSNQFRAFQKHDHYTALKDPGVDRKFRLSRNFQRGYLVFVIGTWIAYFFGHV